MEVKLPASARWVPGPKAGSMVLVDPHGVRMMQKVATTKIKIFWCSRARDLGGPVRLTLNRETDMITRYISIPEDF